MGIKQKEDMTMKKIINDIKTFAALLMAGAAFTACSSDDNITGEQPTALSQQTYTMTVNASKGGDAATRALSLDGNTLNATWAEGEKVAVYNVTKSATLGGYLEVQSAGTSTTLKGSLTGTVEAGDALRLSFLNPIYSAQDGTLAYIASNCDYAVAMVTVASVSDGNITTDADADFTNQQAIVKFRLQDTEGNDLNASSLTIATASNGLLKGQFHDTPETKHTGYTVTAGTGGFNDDESHTSLLDGNKGTKWCANNGPWNVTFNTASPVQVDGYTLTTGGDTGSNSGRNPKNWTLKGKLNESDAWTTIATVTNDNTIPAANTTDVDFVVDKPGSYQYFYFEVTANQGGDIMQLAELQLWKASDATTSVYGPITITPASATNELTVALRNENGAADTYTLTANVGGQTYPYVKSGVNFVDGKYYEITVKMPKLYPFSDITVLGGQQGNDGGSESYDKLFDGNKSTKWCSFTNYAGSYADRVSNQGNVKDQIIWKTASSVVLAYYILNTGGDTGSYPGRNWKSWTIYGANFANDSEATIDATGWNEIQKVENDNVLQAANNADCLYAILDNKTSYQYYRLVIEDIKSTDDNVQQMSLMTLFTK